jgi:hypothetical protein
MQCQLMYFPTASVPTPGEIGLAPVEAVSFKSDDGIEVNGWFLTASEASPQVSARAAAGVRRCSAHLSVR